LYLICFVFAVLLCVPALQHNKERNFPCQQCEQRLASKGALKSHVRAVVSAGEAGLCACDRPSDVFCVLLYMQHEEIPRARKEQKKCTDGRRKSQCKDCGTGRYKQK
jgi:hypothetical protein